MKWVGWIVALALAGTALAQGVPSKKKKKPAKTEQKAHHKPTADQIRKFNELEKKK